MRLTAVAPVVVLIGACGTQDLRFDQTDAAPDAPSSTSGEGCSNDGDCPFSGLLYCDTTSGRCVTCVKDEQCADPAYGVCDRQLALCVQCEVDADCHGGVCETTTHRCVTPCSEGGDCGGGSFCNASKDQCVECLTDLGCQTTRAPYCDPAIGQCVQCTKDSDCSLDRPICNRTTGRCVECLSTEGCRPDEVCLPFENVCYPTRGSPYDGGGGGSGGPEDDGSTRNPL